MSNANRTIRSLAPQELPDDFLFRVPRTNLIAFLGCLALGGLAAVQGGALAPEGVASLRGLVVRDEDSPVSEALDDVLAGADELRVLGPRYLGDALEECIARVEEELRALPRDWIHDLRVYRDFGEI